MKLMVTIVSLKDEAQIEDGISKVGCVAERRSGPVKQRLGSEHCLEASVDLSQRRPPSDMVGHPSYLLLLFSHLTVDRDLLD